MKSRVHRHAVINIIHVIPLIFTWQPLIRMPILHRLRDDVTFFNPRPRNHPSSPWVTFASYNTLTVIKTFHIQFKLCSHSEFRSGWYFTWFFLERFRRDSFCGKLRTDGGADGPIEWQLINELWNRELLAFRTHYELEGDGVRWGNGHLILGTWFWMFALSSFGPGACVLN